MNNFWRNFNPAVVLLNLAMMFVNALQDDVTGTVVSGVVALLVVSVENERRRVEDL